MKNNDNPNKRYVLSVDGGGIRGIIPAFILSKVDDKLSNDIISYFDLAAGTSTGSILAAGLGAGYTPQEMLDLYLVEGPKIFSHKLPRKLYSWAYGSKYPDKNIDEQLEKYFGDLLIKELMVDYLATTFNMTTDKPKFWSTSQEGNFKVSDVVRASSSAPTYFNPKRIRGRDHVDGGLVMNSPSMCAYVEARKEYGLQKEEDIFLLSLGTGTYIDRHEGMRNWMKFKWISPIVDIAMSADAGIMHYILSELYNSSGNKDNYYRINGVLPKWAKLKMDKTDKKSLKILLDVAETIYEKNENKIKSIINVLENK